MFEHRNTIRNYSCCCWCVHTCIDWSQGEELCEERERNEENESSFFKKKKKFDACLGDLIHQSVIQSNMINDILSAFKNPLPTHSSKMNQFSLDRLVHAILQLFCLFSNKSNLIRCDAMHHILIYTIVAFWDWNYMFTLFRVHTMHNTITVTSYIVTMEMCSILFKNLH